MKHIFIYTDGACRGNPGPGGFAALLRFGQHEKQLTGSSLDTTNNRMEMMAAITALRSLKEPCKIDLYTDSLYLKKGITEWLSVWKKNHWKKSDKKPVKNADLWQELDHEVARHHIAWHWVKAHNGHDENELVDELANKAIDELLKRGK
ncbi:MAG: ribonuclease HI [Gammaproteobacteria bacterium RIFCSPHIGHO2_12_FULL_38_14]|nr:MAG: ribonuclease HI [Gammaproteobacteria bacterium RIFCSPHIGHO2_12_FULL_38_14]